MLTLPAFLLALTLLIFVHEYGHYRVAKWCGVRVVRFSIGFGPVLWRWYPRSNETEFTLCAVPLGGYVRMLDEREGKVDAAQRHLAFNQQKLHKRALIVAAGPAANLVLAVLFYAVVHWTGVVEPSAVVATPPAGSMAQQAGMQGGERITQVQEAGAAWQSVQTMTELRWLLTQAALEERALRLQTQEGREFVLPMNGLQAKQADIELLRRIGLDAPFTPAKMGEILPDGAAQRAGLKAGDQILRVNGTTVSDGRSLRELIRASNRGAQAPPMQWQVQRDGRELTIAVSPTAEREGDLWVGRIGAYVGGTPELVTVQLGPIEGLGRAVSRTWEACHLSLRMIWKMITGEASLKNLSGPLTIADYAGQSAKIGLTQYLLFLAMISVSLGVLNLLPLPVLDGGHLLYYLWEAVTGRPISDFWVERLQRGGIFLLVILMSIALFNDLARLFS